MSPEPKPPTNILYAALGALALVAVCVTVAFCVGKLGEAAFTGMIGAIVGAFGGYLAKFSQSP